MNQGSSAIRKAAISLLARREHSCQELQRKLQKKGSDAAAIQAVLDDLCAKSLQSDARFTASYIRSRIAKGYGPLSIRSELQARGIAGELIEQHLTEADVDWLVLAAQVRQKRFGEHLPGDFSERVQQARFLQYRGFTQEHITMVFRT